jgi:hypothetical protein
MNTNEDTHNYRAGRKPPPDVHNHRNRQQGPIWPRMGTLVPSDSVDDRAAAGGAAVLVSGRPQVTPGGLGADVAPDATNTIPLAAPRQATTDGEVSA